MGISDNQPKTTRAKTDEFVNDFHAKLKNGKATNDEVLNFLHDSNSQRFFQYNTEEFYDVFASIIDHCSDKQFFIQILKTEYNSYKRLIDNNFIPDKFFKIVCNALFKKTHQLSAHEQVFIESSRLLQRSFFSKNLKVLTSFIDGECKLAYPDKYPLCKSFFKYLQTLYNSNETESALGIKLIFYSFAHTINEFSFTYKIFVALVYILGFDIKHTFNLDFKLNDNNSYNLDKSLRILNELLQVLIQTKPETDCEINNVKFGDFIQHFLQSVVSTSQKSNRNSYELIVKFIEINPLVVEALINDIIIYATLADNSNCLKDYENLMIKILGVYSKLHRIQNFISKILPTLKSGLEDRKLSEPIYKFQSEIADNEKSALTEYKVELIFPKAVLDYFTTCITNLASWQILNLFKTLLYHLGRSITDLPDIEADDIAKYTYMEVLSTLLSWFLCSVRIAEHTVLKSSIEKFLNGLEELKIMLGLFGKTLLHREHNHILMRAFLNICYNWGEINMILEYYAIDVDIKMKKNVDNDYSACNLTYLHSYLSVNEWCLISERITNFGEPPCKNTMNKLFAQKLRANLIFEETIQPELISNLIKHFTTQPEMQVEILSDKFIVNNILDKFPTSSIIDLCEIIVSDLIAQQNIAYKLDKSYLFDSQLLTNGILTVICNKLGKLVKQKRKHDDNSPNKPLVTKILACLPSDGFLNCELDEYLKKIVEILGTSKKTSDKLFDLKGQEEKIEFYFKLLTNNLPIPFCKESVQKVLILLVLALENDLVQSNCSDNIKLTCEQLIISLVFYKKFDLLDLFSSDSLLANILDNFYNYEEFVQCLTTNVFRNEDAVLKFRPAVDLITNNVKEVKFLKCSVIVLNQLNKMKKTKMGQSIKETCTMYKSDLCTKLVKLLSKKSPDNHLINAYALILRILLAKDENDGLAKMTNCLTDYIEFALVNVTSQSLKGILQLHTTILHNRSTLKGISEDYPLRVWNSLQNINIDNENVEEYANLVVLLASYIPNEKFLQILEELLNATKKSIDSGESAELFKHLKTWSSIVGTNFNAVKTKTIHSQLELLLQKLMLLIKSDNCHHDNLFAEIIHFQVAIIQLNHLPLTSALIDYFLLTVTLLMVKRRNAKFNHIYNLSMSLMENLLKHRNPLVMDRLPPYLQQYKLLLHELCMESNSLFNKTPGQVQQVADCAHQLEKLTKNLVACPKDMSRISLYLIADILKEYESVTLYPTVKIHLNNCIYSLMSLCDQHAVQFLMRVLSNASTEIFKIMYDNYKKYYKFTGKV